jgi:acetyl esterase/lipase
VPILIAPGHLCLISELEVASDYPVRSHLRLRGHQAAQRLNAWLNLLPALDPMVGDTVELYSRWQDQSGNARMLIVPEAPHGFHRLPTRLAGKSLAYAYNWIGAFEPLEKRNRAMRTWATGPVEEHRG